MDGQCVVRRGLRALAWGLLLGISTTACVTNDEAEAPLASEQPGFSGEARDLLSHLVDDGSLVDGLADPDPARRRLAARGLARLPAVDPPAPVVGALATESDPETLALLCFAVGRWAEPSSRELLRNNATHPSEVVRAAAVDALSRLKDDRLTTDLVQALSDRRAAVRGAAALGLARLDARRSEHERQATETQMRARDQALHRLATDDPDPAVRWRATYALASVRPRPVHIATLMACMDDPHEPLVRAFALRGLISHGRAGDLDGASLAAPRVLDADARVATEAGRVVAELGSYQQVFYLAKNSNLAGIRVLAWEGMGAARARDRQDGAGSPEALAALNALDSEVLAAAEAETSAWVRRAALVFQASVLQNMADALGADWRELVAPAAELERGRSDVGGLALTRLATSLERRDREAAADLLGRGVLRDDDVLTTLLADPEPAVRAAALPILELERLSSLWSRLREALEGDDVAAMGAAATACAPIVASGRAPPWLTLALATALDRSARDWRLEEARVELADAMGLPPLDPVPPRAAEDGRTLLELLVAWDLAAADDPSPRLVFSTDRGELVVELDRALAPRHVENVLELAAAGVYDGLDFHRVVPDFVLQGLDPRGDGWGTGGRRVPDEFSPTPYLTGTLGMPRVQRPHTGGCQIFITHLPTPRLDGEYTVFGQVVAGLELLPLFEVGDRVHRVRRQGG
ncbi:MAG: hypothetical protein DRQ55_11060 [Planctomycetota bacterium]|nr:MAG: hypothetical protein DRQ55_11060 [Planctomycetota bacterium]